MMDDAEKAAAAAYRVEYDKAAQALDEAEKPTTPRDESGRFTKAEETPVAADKPAETPEPEAKPEPEPTMAELRAEMARLAKVATDNQAWGTRNAQELADLKRAREAEQREALKPKILTERPDLVEAIRYVNSDPAPKQQAEAQGSEFDATVAAAHPDIPTIHLTDPELYKALLSRRQELGAQWDSSPLVAIREISAEKVAFAKRQAQRQVEDAVAKATQKAAMSVPGSGAGTRLGSNSDADAVARIRNMSNADFDAERRRVLGY